MSKNLMETVDISQFLNPLISTYYEDEPSSVTECIKSMDDKILSVYYDIGAVITEGAPPPIPPDPAMGGAAMDPMAAMGMGATPPAPPPPQTGPMMDPGTGLRIPAKVDPITGLEIPRIPVLGNPDGTTTGAPLLLKDINKINELKKIHNYILSLKRLLESQFEIEYKKIVEIVQNSLDYFYTILRNLDSFVNFIDDIILKYKRFILVTAMEIKRIKKILDVAEKENDKKDEKDDNKNNSDKKNPKEEFSDFIDLFDESDDEKKLQYGDGLDSELSDDEDDAYFKRALKKILKG